MLERKLDIVDASIDNYLSLHTVARPGPTTRYIETDSKAKELAFRYGKRREIEATKIWGDRNDPLDSELLKVGEEVRSRLQPVFRQKTFYKAGDIEEIYQDLTDPPEVLFLGDERLTPSWEPLTTLFRIADEKYSTTLLKDFRDLGDTNSKVQKNIKFLIETALILERLTNGPSPFPDDIVIPNVWFGKIAQFDGILISPENVISQGPDMDVPRYIEQGGPYSILEAKVDFRDRYITGENNPLNRHIHPRHIKEIARKFERLILATDGQFSLPKSIVFVYLRGTQDHIIHTLPLNLCH